MLIFKQLFDQDSSTYTYVLGDDGSGEAVIIDPVFEKAQRDRALLAELGLTLRCSLETHCHADHITGGWVLKHYTGADIAVAKATGCSGADRYLQHGDQIAFGPRHLQVRATPGHTDGCVSYVLDDESMVFTGDALLIRGCGRTDFQQGDPRNLYRSIHEQIYTLADACIVYPGHDYRGITASSVGEERRFNPRLGGEIGVDDFVGYMNNLGLDHPRKMAEAVPANLKCGRPEHDTIPGAEPDWARLNFTFAGIWEIEPEALEEVASAVQLVDVRESTEFDGPLGHIARAILIPLGELSARVGELDASRPIVTVCRSGGRSAQAVNLLKKSGLQDVANLAGGMLRWRAEGHAVA